MKYDILREMRWDGKSRNVGDTIEADPHNKNVKILTALKRIAPARDPVRTVSPATQSATTESHETAAVQAQSEPETNGEYERADMRAKGSGRRRREEQQS